MRIKEFLVTRYGPLSYGKGFKLKGFDLFWGKNGRGKTLTIDALVRMLIGNKKKDLEGFKRIERVDENPEGYAVVAIDGKGEVKLPEKGSIEDNFDGLTSRDFRNIFIIRDSDLTLDKEGDFYTSITERLTGLRTSEITRIKGKVLDLGRLTEGGDFSDTKENEKIKTRINDALALIDDIGELAKRVKDEGFDEIVARLVTIKEDIEGIEGEINDLEDARLRERYERGKGAIDELKDALGGFKRLERYDEKDERAWRDAERDIEESYKKEMLRLQNELGGKTEELKVLSEKLEVVNRDFRSLDKRKERIDGIKTEIKMYEIERGELADREVKNSFFTSTGRISEILLVISLLLIGLNQFSSIFISDLENSQIVLYILPFTGLFLLSTIVFLIIRFLFVKKKAWLNGFFERIKSAVSKFGLDANSIGGINHKIQTFEENYRKKSNELQETKNKGSYLKGEIDKIKDVLIPEFEHKITETRKEIDEIKRKSGVETRGEYRERLDEKQGLKESIREKINILDGLFKSKGKEIRENIDYWDEELKGLEGYRTRAVGIDYNGSLLLDLKEKKKELEDRRDGANERMEDIREELKEIERRATESLPPGGDRIFCDTSRDLGYIEMSLRKFVDENVRRRENALGVIEIFREIEMEERKRVSELFGKKSPVSRHLLKITDGLYEEVSFSLEKGDGKGIELRRNDGERLNADKLSGGEFDQLYLSIRLALGERLLGDRKGFFIMDDPFVKADPDRLVNELEMLKEISNSGWQVIYFSAKGEVKEALKGDIEMGTIGFHEIQDKGV